MSESEKGQLQLVSSTKQPAANRSASRRTRVRPDVAMRLFEEAQAMEAEDATRAGTVGYLGRSLVQATLPYKEPDSSLPVWFRQVGDITLMIKPGYYLDKEANAPKSIGYPSGSMPRLLLAWLSTEAVRTKEREIVLGKQLSDFMTELGMKTQTGGKNGNITRLRDQMKRLFAADMAIVRGGSPDDMGFSDSKFTVAKRTNLWWDPRAPEQAGLWESTVLLSEDLFKELIENPVPIDMRRLGSLSAAPMAIDLYCWLTYRFFSLTKPTTVPWEALWIQFGSDTSSVKKFKELFKATLEKVLITYWEAKAIPVKSGLLIEPSRTSVPKRKPE